MTTPDNLPTTPAEPAPTSNEPPQPFPAVQDLTPSGPETEAEPLTDKLKSWVIGKPRDLDDRSLFKHLSLVAFLAWVGLGADGLSSSCYGPAEAFHSLGEHTYLAVFLALATIATVFIISACYGHIIELFPSGGGGYLVASKLLGRKAGVVSGCALLVDYVLTITVSIAAAGDAIFGLIDPAWSAWKVPAELALLIVLIVLNLRGVKESVLFLLPIFLLFLLTHTLLIGGVLVMNLGEVSQVAGSVVQDVSSGLKNPELGLGGMLIVLLYAYSLGGGTYTGIEAVSNSMPVMREPRVATGQRTMRLMALSLSLTAGGLILGFLLLHVPAAHDTGKTMNQILTELFVDELRLPAWAGQAFVWLTIFSEGALLFVAAQAGFIDGPRVLANLAIDSWVPHWFATLSERLTAHNGVLLMGAAAMGALWYTNGNVGMLVLMYSINVFLTFSLSMVGMCRHWWQEPKANRIRGRRLALFAAGAGLCLTILVITVVEKFTKGGWLTLAVTGACVGLCLWIHGYYDRVNRRLRKLDETLRGITTPTTPPNTAEPNPSHATAAILVGGYSGIGIHTMMNTVRFAPGYYRNMVFISVGVADSGNFKGAEAVDDLRQHTEESLHKYVELARQFGFPATSFMRVGTDAVDELEKLCLAVAKQFPRVTIFAGQLVFQRDAWYQRLLHNFTAFALQRRLQWVGLPMVILPTRVR